jgi:acyl dehydratase
VSTEPGQAPGTGAGLAVRVDELAGLVGRTLGPTRWRTVTQQQIDQFADLTDDHYFLHVDSDRAARSRYGSTIAHGFFTVSLLAPFMTELLTVTDSSASVNYGIDRLRFPSHVPVDARIRAVGTVGEATPFGAGTQVRLDLNVQVDRHDKPAIVAQVLVRHYL